MYIKYVYTLKIMNKIFNRRKKLVVSHFSKYGELKMEFNIPVKVKYNYERIVQRKILFSFHYYYYNY